MSCLFSHIIVIDKGSCSQFQKKKKGSIKKKNPICIIVLGGSDGKESTCNAGDLDSIPRLGRSSGGGHGNLLQYSCLENPHGQRSLVGYSPLGCKESDMIERLSTALDNHLRCQQFQSALEWGSMQSPFWSLSPGSPSYHLCHAKTTRPVCKTRKIIPTL